MTFSILANPDLAPILAALPHARLVGGSVRDALAGVPVADIDLATPDTPEATMQALSRAGIRTIPTGLAHGTITALSGHRPFEITTLRRDEATDGRHAQVAWTQDWREDAARRDFTINAMSMDRDGTVYDFFGGQADLQAGHVRFVGDAAQRINEDFLRILRFFRFYARYARGAPDAEALAAISASLVGLRTLSAERVWSELKRILATPDPGESVALMEKLGVLAEILPAPTDPAGLHRLIAAGAPSDPILRLAALAPSQTAQIADRLKLSGAERERLTLALAGPVPGPEDEPAQLRRFLAEEPAETLIDRVWLRTGDGPEWSHLRENLAAIPRPIFPLEGRHALALGATPGPAVGEALRRVRLWWLEGGCSADESACAEVLKQLLMAQQ